MSCRFAILSPSLSFSGMIPLAEHRRVPGAWGEPKQLWRGLYSCAVQRLTGSGVRATSRRDDDDRKTAAPYCSLLAARILRRRRAVHLARRDGARLLLGPRLCPA